MGYPFRGAIVPGTGDGVAVIQMSDLGESMSPDCSTLCRVDIDEIKSGHRIRENDVIFRSRGNFPAGYWIKSPAKDCVAAAPLLRIRMKSNALHPGYLTWYLRQEAAQSYFESSSQGSSLRMVGIDVLKQLEVPLVQLDLQTRIAELAKLSEQEAVLSRRLQERKKVYINSIINHRIGEKR